MSESRGGRPGLFIPEGPYGLCGRRATLNELFLEFIKANRRELSGKEG